MVDNALISYGNVTDLAVLSGGSSVPTMPLTNLQDPLLGVKWRSTDLALASTQFKATFEDPQVVRVVSIAHHNLSVDARIRIRASEDPSFPVLSVGVVGSPIGLLMALTYSGGGVTVYDTGWIDVWPSVYSSLDLEWEADNFWNGKFLPEDIEAYNTFSHVFPDNIRVGNWLFEIDDHANTSGYVEAGRLFMAPSWQPSRNASFGATLAWEDPTEVQAALSGAEHFDVKQPYRVAQLRFDMMTEDEGLLGPFEIMRRAGVHGEILFMWDPSDTIHAPRRQFLGRFRTLSPLEFPDGFINGADFRTTTAMELKERVA